MLDAYLNRTEKEVRSWEAGIYDALVRPLGGSPVLYGAGKLGRMTCAKLRTRGLEPLAFSDQNPALWGTRVEGLAVLSPEEAARVHGSRAAFVVTIWNYQHAFLPTQSKLLGLGCEKVVPCPALFYKYAEDYLPYFSMDLPHKIIEQRDRVRSAYDLMSDEESRQEFLREMRWRMDLDLSGPPSMNMTQHHFPTDLLQLSHEDVLFDCGAFDGDTLFQFLHLTGRRFRKILCFEPDPYNYGKLERQVATLPEDVLHRVEIYNVAIGSRAETLRFNAEGLASSGFDPSGCTEVEAIPLDSFKGRERPTYIKMDIEGAEVDALHGGESLIRECTPKLAVCVYHRPDHLWEVPLAISAFSPGYGLYLRRYAEIPWELVCYGIP